MTPVETFIAFPERDAGTRVVRVFLPEELSSWGVHGAPSDTPFWDVPRTSRRFRVSHTPTGRADRKFIGLGFDEALDLAREIEASFDGWSQPFNARLVDGTDAVTGWTPEMTEAALGAHARWAKRWGRT